MTEAERQAAEAALNAMIGHAVVVVTLGWWCWWLWRRLGLPALLKPLTQQIGAWVTAHAPRPPDGQTDRQTDRVSAEGGEPSPLQLDRTRRAVVKALVAAGWSVGEIRAVVKGDNGAIGSEVESVRAELGLAPAPARTITVRDHREGERTIAL